MIEEARIRSPRRLLEHSPTELSYSFIEAGSDDEEEEVFLLSYSPFNRDLPKNEVLDASKFPKAENFKEIEDVCVVC